MTRTRSAVGNCRRMALLIVAAGCTLLVSHLGWAQAAREHKDVIYATVDGKDLGLDIYLPAGVEAPPLLVWVHGGAWSSGTKAQVPMVFVANGIAAASIDFRQSTDARFPAQVHDIKAAIRIRTGGEWRIERRDHTEPYPYIAAPKHSVIMPVNVVWSELGGPNQADLRREAANEVRRRRVKYVE